MAAPAARSTIRIGATGRWSATTVTASTHDPFFLPGLQDLTAWVDFSAAAQAAAGRRPEVAAYATQAHMLLASGVLDEAAGGRRPAADPGRLREVQEIQRLLLPGEMGERFKVLALTRDFTPEFPLTVRDLRGSL